MPGKGNAPLGGFGANRNSPGNDAGECAKAMPEGRRPADGRGGMVNGWLREYARFYPIFRKDGWIVPDMKTAPPR